VALPSMPADRAPSPDGAAALRCADDAARPAVSARANHRVNVNWPLFMAPPHDTVDIIPDIIPDMLPA